MNQIQFILSSIFLTNDKSRLRAGWRLGIVLLLTELFFSIVDWMRSVLSLTEAFPLVIGLGIDLMVVVSAIYLTRRFVDKRSFTSLGLRLNKQTVFDILTGIMISFVLMLVVYIIEYSLGWLTFQSFAWQTQSSSEVFSQTIQGFIIQVHAGFKEELIFRGYMLQTLISGLNLFWGIVVSSLLFGLDHLSNPNSTWLSAALISLNALVFVYAYLRTVQLWLSVGLHFGWNFFQGTIFGFTVSGFEHPGLFHTSISAPTLWTGGAFGPEAGLIILPICLLGAVLIYLYTKQREIFS